jgi:hypothetical protein
MRWISRHAGPAVLRVAGATEALGAVMPGAPRRQRSGLRQTSHRPWRLAPAAWVPGQSWLALLFEVRGARARGVLPSPVLSRLPEHNVRTCGDALGISLDGDPVPRCAERQDVVFWPLAPAGA